MTLTFNPEKYKEILSEYQPKLIKTEAENEHALMIVEQLMHLPSRSPEQEEIYELLVVLIERFEQVFYNSDDLRIPKSSHASMLLFLMDQQDLQPIDLVPFFGSEDAVKDVIAGQSDVDKETAERLSELFHVDSSLFGKSR